MDIYIFFVVVLFGLAISDLIVGVSNDAVNFLVSAIGSKAAPFWVIMLIASIGIFVGATFSSGMMEVARKGIFHPDMFAFSEIMVIFLAVMITDIILLDLFNTFGMPTSTTVSIVFELLGGAVAVATIKTWAGNAGELSEYINSAKALAIISGILLSVVVAFSVGAIVQYITRLIFSFRTNKTLRYYGALWGGIAITSIVYFMLIKGLKGSSYATYEMANGEILKDWVKHFAVPIIAVSFVAWTIILQILSMVFKVNILKIVVLAGTFALAMAFAGNDLVNFIGVPLAGLRSFEAWAASGQAADMYSMGSLAEKVSTPAIYLLFAGAVMVGALIFSKKSRSVTQTSLNLSRQDEGDERFGSSGMSRSIVRVSMMIGNSVKSVIPNYVLGKMESRFEQVAQDSDPEQAVDFDLIRASVNLMVASILISFATSLKLPLSTTYVTFMVAMGTSLADGAWGRESAVYRITGVVSVIGGWFLTAFIAFSAAFLVALIISWGGVYAVVALLLFVIFMVFKSHKRHKLMKVDEDSSIIDEVDEKTDDSAEKVLSKCNKGVSKLLIGASANLTNVIESLVNENRKELKHIVEDAAKRNDKIRKHKGNSYKVVMKLQEESIETGHYYVQLVEYQREMTNCLVILTRSVYEHVDNNHKAMVEIQAQELREIIVIVNEYISYLQKLIQEEKTDFSDEATEKYRELLGVIEKYHKSQIKRIKSKEVGTRNSMLFMNILAELRNYLLFGLNVYKSQSNFVKFTKEHQEQ